MNWQTAGFYRISGSRWPITCKKTRENASPLVLAAAAEAVKKDQWLRFCQDRPNRLRSVLSASQPMVN
jgi:hypothetical protein